MTVIVTIAFVLFLIGLILLMMKFTGEYESNMSAWESKTFIRNGLIMALVGILPGAIIFGRVTSIGRIVYLFIFLWIVIASFLAFYNLYRERVENFIYTTHLLAACVTCWFMTFMGVIYQFNLSP